MHRQDNQQLPTLDDVSHKPVSSSDEDISELRGGAFENLAPSSKNSRASVETSPTISDRGRHTLRSFRRPELGVDKSNILSTQFSSAASSSGPSGGQSSKRTFLATHSGTVDEDERTEFWGSKKPKTKKHYGQGRTIDNINGSQEAPQEERTKKAKGYSKPGRRKPQAQEQENLLSPSENEAGDDEPKKEAFKAPRKIESPRAKRASRRWSRDSRAASQAQATNGFKIPMKVPAPEITKQESEPLPNFKVPPILATDVIPPRANRSKKSFKKPESVLAGDGRRSGDNIGVVETTRPKSDLRDFHSAIPSSSMTASSRRSTSNDRTSAFSSPFSSPPSSSELDALIEEFPSLTSKIAVFHHPATTAQCPYCKGRVDRDCLLAYDTTVRLSVREQIRFCRAHRVRSAEVEWKEKGYPTIDWPSFDKRLTKFHAHLDDILENRRASFYRNAYEERFKSRPNETAEQSVKNLELGYYGSRGAESMMQNIITRFTTKLRHLSTKDKLISSNSVSRYVQAVLAPEMAVMLVKEDMGLDDEGARALLMESAALGNLLNEEEDDTI